MTIVSYSFIFLLNLNNKIAVIIWQRYSEFRLKIKFPVVKLHIGKATSVSIILKVFPCRENILFAVNDIKIAQMYWGNGARRTSINFHTSEYSEYSDSKVNFQKLNINTKVWKIYISFLFRYSELYLIF